MSAVFVLDQVLACTDSATSEYSTTLQCLSALLGRTGRVNCILSGLIWKKVPTHLSLLHDYCLVIVVPSEIQNLERKRGKYQDS